MDLLQGCSSSYGMLEKKVDHQVQVVDLVGESNREEGGGFNPGNLFTEMLNTVECGRY